VAEEIELEVDTMPKPTYKQEQYAESLVARLREENTMEAEGFARMVSRCQDIGEMSNLIDRMKRLLKGLEGDWR
jgi:hypothetical protein